MYRVTVRNMFLSIEIEHNPTTVVFPIRGTATDFDQLTDIPFPVNGRWDDLLNDQSVLVKNFRLFNPCATPVLDSPAQLGEPAGNESDPRSTSCPSCGRATLTTMSRR